ncbi:23c176b5-c88e-4445-b9cd-5d4c5c17954f [Sclerotinia trifoliorum]|uniref:23c176b5-c88e-4445-b9cd-5d4c5c17954f n=1 Tax=Sclerotinia trifoliorum TaxID=28548 RepID=A0A8H2ZJ62_9HELO|nr:23c176b5-c88e-4445-b9cd-5d4c5c17954f [Sclerotinia trifoliorum]
MSNSYVRPPHYQRHYQSMLLNLCSIYPYFDTDGFDRAYIAEVSSVASQYPASSLDFCYYWTEKVLWDKFQLSSAYGEFPGRYGGPGYITQQQIGSIQLPPTPGSAQQVSRIAPTSLQQTLEVPRRTVKPTEPIREQAAEVPATSGTPAPAPAQKRVDLPAVPSVQHSDQPPQEPSRNHTGDYLKLKSSSASSPTKASQDLAKETLKRDSSRNTQSISETPGLIMRSGPQIETPSSLLAARLASPGTPSPSSVSTVARSAPPTSFESLPPLLDPDLLYKDPTTGEVITMKMFERRCLSRGAQIAIEHAQAAVKSEPSRVTKPLARTILERSLITALASIVQEQTQH